MDKFNFDQQFNALERNYALFKRLLSLSILANIVLVIVLMMCINREKIILVPQVAPETKLWIGQQQVSNNYLTILSRNVLDLMLNATPDNVDAQHQEVLKFIDSKHEALMKGKLANIAKVIRENNISQNFFINTVKIIHNKNIVFIRGTLDEYIDQTLSSSVGQIYKLTFKVQNYGVQLDTFELINNNDPQLKDINL